MYFGTYQSTVAIVLSMMSALIVSKIFLSTCQHGQYEMISQNNYKFDTIVLYCSTFVWCLEDICMSKIFLFHGTSIVSAWMYDRLQKYP